MERKIPERGNRGTNFSPRNNKNEQSKKRIKRNNVSDFYKRRNVLHFKSKLRKNNKFQATFPATLLIIVPIRLIQF